MPLPTDAAGAFDAIVAVSPEMAEMVFVTPGDPNSSYLWHKLAGTQNEVSMGGGSTMPLGPSLCPEELLLINKWIVQGAELEP